MKRILFFITLLSFFNASESKAGWGRWLYDTEDILPEAEFGPKAGMHSTYLSGSTLWNETFKYGPTAGLFFGVHRKMIGGRIETSLRRVKYTSNSSKIEAEILNVEVPILFEFRPIKELKIHLGGQFTGYPIAQDHGKDISRWFAGQEICGVFGAEGDLPWRFTVGARVVKGFSDINEYDSRKGKWRTTSAQAYIGFRIIE